MSDAICRHKQFVGLCIKCDVEAKDAELSSLRAQLAEVTARLRECEGIVGLVRNFLSVLDSGGTWNDERNHFAAIAKAVREYDRSASLLAGARAQEVPSEGGLA